MTYDQIIKSAQDGAVLTCDSADNIDAGSVAVHDNEKAAQAYLVSVYDGSGFTVTGFEWRDVEVRDPKGYYSGTKGRFSRFPVMVPVTA